MELDYSQVEETIRNTYRLATAQYRRDDEIEVTTSNHRRLGGTLGDICFSFGRPIAVLDVGCGTGRYFHCLKNVERLVGIDISEDMLMAARKPVFAEQVTARNIELKLGNAYLISFSSESFDFIYSLGMFGHGCPVTMEILNKFHAWLKPGGILLFNTVDFTGLPWRHRARRRMRDIVYHRLPRNWQQKLLQREQRSPFFALSQPELETLVEASRFKEFSVRSHSCESPLWNGRHLQCFARKHKVPSPNPNFGEALTP